MEKKSETGGAPFCDGKDEEFTKGFYRICCLSNKGQLPGHYLKIQDGRVIANAAPDDEKNTLKIRAVQNDEDELIMIIENQNNEALVVDRDERNDKYVIAVENNEQLSEIHRLRDAEQYTNNYLFKKVPREPGSEIFQITSNLDGKPLVVAFDENGEAMDPTKNPHDDRSLFKLYPVPTPFKG